MNDDHFSSAFSYAILRGNDEEKVVRLLDQDPQLANRVIRTSSWTWAYPLFIAAMRGQALVVSSLLDYGAMIDQSSPGVGGHTALVIACIQGHEEVAELMLRRGANPAIIMPGRTTPLLAATSAGRPRVVRCLLKHPSVLTTIDYWSTNDPNKGFDSWGMTALHVACCRDDEAIMSLLLEAGADPMVTTSSGHTAMDMARIAHHHACHKLLQEWERSCLLVKARCLYDVSSSQCSGRQYDPNQRGLPGVIVAAASNDDDDVVGSVVEYVVCGGLKTELFLELMEMMGRAGVRRPTGKEKERDERRERRKKEKEEDERVVRWIVKGRIVVRRTMEVVGLASLTMAAALLWSMSRRAHSIDNQNYLFPGSQTER